MLAMLISAVAVLGGAGGAVLVHYLAGNRRAHQPVSGPVGMQLDTSCLNVPATGRCAVHGQVTDYYAKEN
jgi:hypothetical protein